MSDFTVVEWTDESVPLLLELARVTLGAGGAVAKTEQFWEWKHRDNPFGRSYGIVAMDEDPATGKPRAAGLRMLLRWRFRGAGDGVVRAARAVDTATHPDCQRRGIFSRLTQQAIADLRADGTQLIYNTPNAKSLPGYLKMGWQVVDKRPIYLLPLRPLRMAWRRIRPQAGGIDASPAAIFDERAVLPWNTFMERYGDQAFALAESWERRRRSVGLRTERSEAYYSWRYGRHPHAAYSVCPLWEGEQAGEKLAGFAVVRANVRFGWQEAVLCEMVLGEPSPGLGRRLLREVARHTRGDYVAAHFAGGTVEMGALRRLGFVRAPGQGMTFTVRPLAEMRVNPRLAGAWDMTLGDLEVF